MQNISFSTFMWTVYRIIFSVYMWKYGKKINLHLFLIAKKFIVFIYPSQEEVVNVL